MILIIEGINEKVRKIWRQVREFVKEENFIGDGGIYVCILEQDFHHTPTLTKKSGGLFALIFLFLYEVTTTSFNIW